MTSGASDVGDVAVAVSFNGISGRFLGGVSIAGAVAGNTGTNGTLVGSQHREIIF